jgi:hypothetical protein
MERSPCYYYCRSLLRSLQLGWFDDLDVHARHFLLD